MCDCKPVPLNRHWNGEQLRAAREYNAALLEWCLAQDAYQTTQRTVTERKLNVQEVFARHGKVVSYPEHHSPDRQYTESYGLTFAKGSSRELKALNQASDDLLSALVIFRASLTPEQWRNRFNPGHSADAVQD